MREVWLQTNRRAILLGMLLPTAIAVSGTALILTAWLFSAAWWWWTLGVLCMAGGLAMVFSLASWLRVPRLAYEEGELLVYVEQRRPIRVPIDSVECFFLGQGPSRLPQLAGREPETANVIVRLSEAAADWKHRDVNPRIAHWCEGYITLCGAWCEPIQPSALRQLNHRLAEVHRQRKSAAGNDAVAGCQQRSAAT